MRKTIDVTITADGRDKGKVFVLKEMPAAKIEKWAARGLVALVKAGVILPENTEGAGLAGIAALGLKAMMGVDFADAEPLLDEMLTCVEGVRPDPSRPHVVRPVIWDGDGADVQEVATLLTLRSEVFELHTGFSMRAVLSRSKTMAAHSPQLNS